MLYTVRMTKLFTKGHLAGCEVHDVIPNCSWKSVTQFMRLEGKSRKDYTITEIRYSAQNHPTAPRW